ncbi:two-component regulator propeller domain-containing protein [Flagellimonas eckloniae]|uniref:hybrid sensor histidine kinase/response regulator transcription factor n=1 Tax=Flagellimonas eckloniae TaxID=346185 RepID=UPI0006DC48A1|nr:two-component regulator propeller domain-containing protein [Allomuricauda eckloniae]
MKRPLNLADFSLAYTKHFCLLFCFILLFIYSANAQNQISFRQLTVKEGLSQNSVVSVAQDSLGYLWLATQDGLNRYDGRSIKQYPFQFTDITRPTFSRLGKIYVDREGQVFIIPSDHKVYKYDKDINDFLALDRITNASTIWQDASKKYWVGTTTGQVFSLEQNLTLTPSNSYTQIKGQIKKIGTWSRDSLFVISEKALFYLNSKTLAKKEIALETLLGEKIPSNLSTAIIDEGQTLWIGYHGDGLFYYDKATKSIRRLRDTSFDGYLPKDLVILDLSFDDENRLWITTYGDGLYLVNFTTNKIIHFSEQKQNPRALHYNDILCVFQDDSKTLWFGTDGAGASFYDAYLEKFNSFTNYQTPANISIDVVRAITLDNTNNVWIGTSGKGLTSYEPATNSWITYTTLNSDISSNRIMSLHYDSDNELWIGTQSGGLSILGKNNVFRTYNETSKIPLSSETIWDIFEDQQNNIWLCTRDDGLIQFDKRKGIVKQYQRFNVRDSTVTRKNIRVIVQDPKGYFWIGTDREGLIKFDPSTEKSEIFITDDKMPSISSNSIKSLYHDENNVLWIGTSGAGLDALNIQQGKFHNYSSKYGLPNNVIYGILPDEAGNLWLSSNKGITKFKVPKDFNELPEITNYDNYDGLATEFNTGAYYKHNNGQLYFGALEGFYWFTPQSISENKYLPKTTITDFKVLNEVKSIYFDTIMKHNENTIDFSFSSLQFSEPEKNQYRYRLLPLEKEWIETGNKNFVRYTHLPPDEYEFQVISSNYDGKWNQNPVEHTFSIAPPWYFNIWSKSFYTLLLLITGLLVYRYLKWRWKMKLDLQLKQEEANRFKKLNDYKSKIYTEIAHEFRTPLTLISGPIESKLSQTDISEEEISRFSMIERNTTRLTNLVDELLQLAKLEEGKFQLQKKWGNLGLFLKSTASSFSYEAEKHKMDFGYKVQDIPSALYDGDVLDKIIVNLISNAIKYGKKGGKCGLTASLSDGILFLEISNDTKTEIEDVQKIFERFYQTDKNSKGAGIGLSLVKELVKLYDGTIEVLQNDGTIRFVVEIAIKTEHDRIKTEPPKISKLEVKKDGENSNRPILLVVEDNVDVRDFITVEFGKSYKVIKAENGKIGIEKALEHVPDIVISDVKMPVEDGIALCNTLKTDERTSHIPIILLTASIDKQNELKGLKAGADDYVTKPFKIKILEKRVSNLVKSRKMLRQRYSQESFLKPKDLAITPTDEVFLNKVQEILDEHLVNPEFNAGKFSNLIGMSRMQLHRKLITYTGISTSGFIRSQRLKQAVQILKTSDATINEVAYTVGFNTPSYFIKCFKEVYKKTPTEYFQSIQ